MEQTETIFNNLLRRSSAFSNSGLIMLAEAVKGSNDTALHLRLLKDPFKHTERCANILTHQKGRYVLKLGASKDFEASTNKASMRVKTYWVAKDEQDAAIELVLKWLHFGVFPEPTLRGLDDLVHPDPS